MIDEVPSKKMLAERRLQLMKPKKAEAGPSK